MTHIDPTSQAPQPTPNRPGSTMKPRALFVTHRQEDRPLFMVLVVLSFLAAITLLGVMTGLRATAHWKSTLDTNVSVLIKPSDTKIYADAQKAKTLLQAMPSVRSVTLLPQSYSHDLLSPWLGQTSLPSDLPLPLLLDVQLSKNQNLDVNTANTAFKDAHIRADIDLHSRWAKTINRAIRAIKLISYFALTLIFSAVGAAAMFAARAAINSHRRVIDVLHQVGAPPSTTARLLSTRLAIFGAKAGLFGVICALILILLTHLFLGFGSSQAGPFLPELHVSIKDSLLLLFIPLLLALLIFSLAWRTVIHTLHEEIYP